MLVCPIAASEPTTIDTTAMISTSSRHSPARWPNGTTITRISAANGATLGAVLMKAVTALGAPS